MNCACKSRECKCISRNLDQIKLGKWEDVMPGLPSNSVDLIVTSPPYNVRLGDNKHKKDAYEDYKDDLPYEVYLGWMMKLFISCNRVLKRGGRLCINIGDGANGQVPTHADFTNIALNLFDLERTHTYMEAHNEWACTNGLLQTHETIYDYIEPKDIDPFEMMTTIVWDKKQIGASTAWGSFKSPSQPSFPTQFEFILVFGKGSLKHEGDKDKISISKDNFIRNSRALWSFLPETRMMKDYDHPAMFPEELPKRLIDHLTYEGDVVLDPFSGAGTTCTVAKKMRRHYIGIEMSQKYYETSLRRLGETPNMVVTSDENGEESRAPEWMS